MHENAINTRYHVKNQSEMVWSSLVMLNWNVNWSLCLKVFKKNPIILERNWSFINYGGNLLHSVYTCVCVCAWCGWVCHLGQLLTLSDKLTGSWGPRSQRQWWEHCLIGVIDALLGTCLLREVQQTHIRLSNDRQTGKVTALPRATQCFHSHPCITDPESAGGDAVYDLCGSAWECV